MEPRILLFPRLAFLYIVLPLEKKKNTLLCVSYVKLSVFGSGKATLGDTVCWLLDVWK